MTPDEPGPVSVDDLLSRAVEEQVRTQDGVRRALETMASQIQDMAGRLADIEARQRERLELDSSVREWMEQEFRSFAEVVREALDASSQQTAATLADAAHRTAEGMEHLASVARQAMDTLAGRVDAAGDELSRSSTQRLDGALDELSQRLEATVAELRASVSDLHEQVEEVSAGLRSEVVVVAEDLRARVEVLSERLHDGVDRAATELRAGVAEATGGLRTDVEESTAALTSTVLGAVEQLVTEVRRDVGRVPSALSDQRASIAAEVRAAISELLAGVTTPTATRDVVRPGVLGEITQGGDDRPAAT